MEERLRDLIEQIDRILSALVDRNLTRTELYNEVESDFQNEHGIEWSALPPDDITHQFNNAIKFLKTQQYIMLIPNEDVPENFIVSITYEGIVKMARGGFQKENERARNARIRDSIFKYGMPIATLLTVILQIVLIYIGIGYFFVE